MNNEQYINFSNLSAKVQLISQNLNKFNKILLLHGMKYSFNLIYSVTDSYKITTFNPTG